MIYFVIGVILLLSIVFFEKKSKRDFFYWMLCLILILLAGLRNSVGGDTLGYMRAWDSLPTLIELRTFDFFGYDKYQPIWYIINAIAKYIYDDFVTMQIILAFIVNITIFRLFNKYSSYRFTCVLVYYLMSYAYFNFEILRESLSISIFLISLPFLIKKKWIKYYLFATLAFLFHTSSIILFFIPLFLKRLNQKLDFLSVIYLTGISLFITNKYFIDFIINNLFPFLEPLAEVYLEWKWSIVGFLISLIKCSLIVLLIILRQKYKVYQSMIDIPLKMYMFFAVFSLVMPIGQRFQNYFVLFFIMGFADLLWRFRGKEFIIKYSIVLFFTSLTVFYYLQNTTNVTTTKSVFGDRYYPYFSVFEEINPQDIYLRQKMYDNDSKYTY